MAIRPRAYSGGTRPTFSSNWAPPRLTDPVSWASSNASRRNSSSPAGRRRFAHGQAGRQHGKARIAVRLSEGTKMSIKAMILAALLGLPLFAGTALAAETGNQSLVDAARQGDRETARALLNSRAKADVAE